MSNDFQLTATSGIRRSAFHEATLRDGCHSYVVASYTISDQVYYPNRLFDSVEEYWKLVNDAVLFDPPVERPIEISGPQAALFVDHLMTRDMTKCAVGQCKYVILCDQSGRLLLDSVILRLAENQYWLSGDLGWIRGLAAGLGMEVDVFLADAAPLQVQGPRSRDVMHAMFGEQVSSLKFYDLTEVSLNGMPLVVTRTGWTGERGYEIYLCDTQRGVELWDAILDHGKPFGLVATGTSGARRVEAGIMDTHLEICPEHNPYELGLERLVHLDKTTPFVGQAALRRIKSEGLSRKLVGYESPERVAGRGGNFPWAVVTGNETIGKATVAVWSPSLERTIGYALVPMAFTELGTPLTIQSPGGPMESKVVSVPFVDPAKQRMRG